MVGRRLKFWQINKPSPSRRILIPLPSHVFWFLHIFGIPETWEFVGEARQDNSQILDPD